MLINSSSILNKLSFLLLPHIYIYPALFNAPKCSNPEDIFINGLFLFIINVGIVAIDKSKLNGPFPQVYISPLVSNAILYYPPQQHYIALLVKSLTIFGSLLIFTSKRI